MIMTFLSFHRFTISIDISADHITFLTTKSAQNQLIIEGWGPSRIGISYAFLRF